MTAFRKIMPVLRAAELQRAMDWYGTREFGMRDPDGYTLAFAEPA